MGIRRWWFDRYGPIEGWWIGAGVMALTIGIGITWYYARGEGVGTHTECAEAYATARTAADTARVDQMIVTFPRGRRPERCGTFRMQDRSRGATPSNVRVPASAASPPRTFGNRPRAS